jgi:hypothetical protein
MGQMGELTDTSITTRDTDQQSLPNGTAHVSCSVSPNGSAFTVNANASLADQTVSYFIQKIDLTATSLSTAADGSVSFESVKTASVYAGATCKFYFTNPKADGTGEGVLAGQIWGIYECPDGITNASLGATCKVGVSYLAFENCSTSAM